jgi:AcrR family transcriptional regulator
LTKTVQHYERTEIRQRQIAEAALAVIAEKGLAGFTTRAIAARIAISDGTIFRHFANKQEIVVAAMHRLEEELLLDTLEDEPDPLARLVHLFRTRAELLGGDKAIGRLVFSHVLVKAAGDEGMTIWRSWRVRTLQLVSGALVALQEAARIRADVSVPALTRVFLGAMLTFANQRAAVGGPIPDLDGEIDRAWGSLEVLFGVAT